MFAGLNQLGFHSVPSPDCACTMLSCLLSLQARGKLCIRYVKDVFESIDNIHLLKIDVDDRESYEAVFAGVGPILHKTEIVQIEMLAEESRFAVLPGRMLGD